MSHIKDAAPIELEGPITEAMAYIERDITFARGVLGADHPYTRRLRDRQAHVPDYLNRTQQLLSDTGERYGDLISIRPDMMRSIVTYDCDTVGRIKTAVDVAEIACREGTDVYENIAVPYANLDRKNGKIGKPAGEVMLPRRQAEEMGYAPDHLTDPYPAFLDKRLTGNRIYLWAKDLMDRREDALEICDLLTDLSLGKPLSLGSELQKSWPKNIILPADTRQELCRVNVIVLTTAGDTFVTPDRLCAAEKATVIVPATPTSWMSLRQNGRGEETESPYFFQTAIAGLVRVTSRLADKRVYNGMYQSPLVVNTRVYLAQRMFETAPDNRNGFSAAWKHRTGERLAPYLAVLQGETDAGVQTGYVQRMREHIERLGNDYPDKDAVIEAMVYTDIF